MTWPGLVRRYGHWTINPRPPTGLAQKILDEIEVGHRAAKVWSWTDHYCPPGQYAEIRRGQAARDARRAAEPVPAPVSEPVPVGQLELFAGAA